MIARPLLFATVDPDVAAATGVPVRSLAVAFLVLLGIAAAEASQITGSLLVFALLVLPPATAQVLTARPLLGICLSVVLGVAVTWAGLAMAYYSPVSDGTSSPRCRSRPTSRPEGSERSAHGRGRVTHRCGRR